MIASNATDIRRNWSAVVDGVIREKPAIIKRTRDYMVLADKDTFIDILSAYSFTADEYIESDGSVTLSLNEIDIVENAETEEKALSALGASVLEYAVDYYNDFAVWSAAPNRKAHIPYVLKALLLDDADKIGECVICRPGKS